MRKRWWISGPRWTFAVTEENGTVVEAAPISKWGLGKPIDVVLRWWRRKGADEIIQLSSSSNG